MAKLPLKFWWDSVVSSTYLINRLPTETLSQKSPFEVLFSRKPDYKFFKVFGWACFPFLRPYQSHKYNFRSSMCVFLGYSPSHLGYRCLHESGRVYIASTVIFDRYCFPFQDMVKKNNQNNDTSQSFPMPYPIVHQSIPIQIPKLTTVQLNQPICP